MQLWSRAERTWTFRVVGLTCAPSVPEAQRDWPPLYSCAHAQLHQHALSLVRDIQRSEGAPEGIKAFHQTLSGRAWPWRSQRHILLLCGVHAAHCYRPAVIRSSAESGCGETLRKLGLLQG